MKKITWTWQKIVALICGFLGIGTLVSCYGMPIDYKIQPDDLVNTVSGTVYGDIDGDGKTEPVQGIEISAIYRTGGSTFKLLKTGSTNTEGNYSLQLDDDYSASLISIECENVDGAENGSFLPAKESYYPGDSITLERTDSLKEE